MTHEENARESENGENLVQVGRDGMHVQRDLAAEARNFSRKKPFNPLAEEESYEEDDYGHE